ncbi:MAG: hypothetical protein ACTIN7_11515, partial [Lactococcus lactis]
RKETEMTTIGKVKIVEIEDGPFMTDGEIAKYLYKTEVLDEKGNIDKKSNAYLRAQGNIKKFADNAPDGFVIDVDGRLTHLIAFLAWSIWSKKYRGMSRAPKFIDYFTENKNTLTSIL